MRAGLVLAGLLAGLPALAQAPQGLPSVSVPGRPPPLPSVPSPIQATPLPPPSAGTPPAAPRTAPLQPVQSEWVTQGNVELRGIDKVMARTTTLSGKVGEALRFGPLEVLVRHCVVRPRDQAPDAAAFLEVSQAGTPVYRGWMILSVPQLGLLEHPTHDIRLGACPS